MNRLIALDSPDPPALHHWREHALTLMLRIILLMPVPGIALDLLRLLPERAYGAIAVELLMYAIIVPLGLNRRIPYQWRTFMLLGMMLLFGNYLLLNTGLISAGRIYIVPSVVIAALMLSRRSMLLTWLGGMIVLTFSVIAFAGKSFAEVAVLAHRLTDPNTLLTNELITLWMGATVALGTSSLVGSLGRSLRATEQALAERDQTNAVLDQRVAERTHALEQAVVSLRASEERLQTILQTALDGFWVIDLQKRFIDVNEAYCAMSGYSRAEILTIGILDVEAVEGVEETEARIRRIIANGSERFETRHRRKDGSLLDLEISVTAFTSGTGELVSFCHDITARNHAKHDVERQLAVQASVARCSQLLLQPVATVAEQQELLSQVLATAGDVLVSGHVAILENFDDPQDGRCARTVAAASTGRGAFAPRHPAARKTPWHTAPSAMRGALEAGESWGGATAVVFAKAPAMLASTNAQGVGLIQAYPITVEGAWWGALVFTDTARAQGWSAAERLLHQLTAELIGTAIQRWQTEADLSLQLRYAEALARCSQALLQPISSDAERQTVLGTVLTVLRETIRVSRVYIYQPPTDAPGEATLRILADSQAPEFDIYREPSPKEVLNAPQAMVAALHGGQWFGGPVPGQFPANPHFQHSLDQNDVQALLMVPIIIGGGLWGVLSVADRIQIRDWDAPTVQVLRTAAEMIATFQQSWEATQTLREREHFIQRVTEASPDIIHVFDLATQRSLFVNRPLDSLFGYTAETIARISLDVMRHLVHPDDAGRVIAHYLSLGTAADGQVIEQECRMRTGDGYERWFASRDLVFARDDRGRPSQILSIAQDITASKRTEQALAASEARLLALRDALPDLLFIVRDDGTFLEFYAPRHADMLVPPVEFLGRPMAEVLPPESAARALQAIAQVHESGELALFEDALTFGQRDHIFEIRVAPIIGDELLFVVRDSTERHRSTQELLRAKATAEAADKAKSTFLAHISHEIRTPLTAIIGMASLLRDTTLAPQQRESVETIHTGAETLLAIIGSILDFSKIEAGQMELTVQPFDLRACLRESHALVAHQAQRKGLALEYVVDPAVPVTLAGDVGRLRQVLVNLLINAVKFTERGAVTLTAHGQPRADAGYGLTITIHDTGIGIAAERLPDIFDPFVQVDSAPTRRYGGTGLGLAISKQLIELMGGQIVVASTLGAGTTFTLSLPLRIAATPSTARESAAMPGAPPASRSLRVLLAEDNLINQEVLRRLLENLGHVTDVAGDGAEALEAIRRQPYDVVLMDIQMPELDGEAATRRIRALTEITQPAIIALTASALRGDRERYLAAGMDDYLSKPVQGDDLRIALDRVGTRIAVAAMRDAAAVPSPAQPRTPAPAPDLVDWALLDRILGGIGGTQAQSLDLVRSLFGTTLATQMVAIEAAVTTDDRPQVRLLAHKLRGGSGQLGAVRLAACWLALEEVALSDRASLTDLLAQARRVYAETLALLTDRLG